MNREQFETEIIETILEANSRTTDPRDRVINLLKRDFFLAMAKHTEGMDMPAAASSCQAAITDILIHFLATASELAGDNRAPIDRMLKNTIAALEAGVRCGHSH